MARRTQVRLAILFSPVVVSLFSVGRPSSKRRRVRSRPQLVIHSVCVRSGAGSISCFAGTVVPLFSVRCLRGAISGCSLSWSIDRQISPVALWYLSSPSVVRVAGSAAYGRSRSWFFARQVSAATPPAPLDGDQKGSIRLFQPLGKGSGCCSSSTVRHILAGVHC